jgi:heme-degrading monooxygenase HmoA
MIKEVSVLTIDPETAEEFERIYKEIAPVLRRQPGYGGDELLKVVENSNEYILIIQWESVEAHTRFIEAEDFAVFAERWGPLQQQALVRHGETIA